MPYLGNPLAFAYSAVSYQDLTGGTGTSFTLNNSVLNSNELEVFVNNVRQEPSVAYTASGTTLTMTGSISASDDFYVVYQGMAKQTVTPAESTNLSITDLTLSGELSLAKAVQGTTLTDTTNTGNVTLDFDTYQNFVLTLTGNVTLVNPTTEAVGQVGSIIFIQDSTGSRTLSLGTDYESVGGSGITLSTAASTTDMVPYVVVASNRILLGTPQLAFS
jgi:hypothetical protein